MGRPAAMGESKRKGCFLFIGNQPALDFLNTCPVQGGERLELLTNFDALLRWFQTAGLISSRDAKSLQQQWGESGPASNTVREMLALRERLRKEVVAWELGGMVHQSTIDELNRLMAEHPMRARLKTIAKTLVKELWFEAQRPEDLFAPLAHYAAILFAGADHDRVRQCDQCVLHFHDTSKKGNRRWCSMQVCGNRLKVAAYAARQRSGS